MTFYAPRGPQKPKMNMMGINHFKLIHFLKDCKERLKVEGEEASAHYMEMLETYFREDYEEGKPLTFKSKILGL